jgi:DNA helicase-2/ATP-dependent DNA helicase PcrA
MTMMSDVLTHDTTYLTKLNPPQRQAVEATDGAVLVLAGAGTGKTRVLTTRIAHLLMTKRAFAGQILAVTFTNKAAREMVERVQHLLERTADEDTLRQGNVTQGMWLGTFHSIAARILRRHAEHIGLTSSFSILDSDDQIRLLKTLLKDANYDEKHYPAKGILAIIQSWKDQGLRSKDVTDSWLTQPNSALALQMYRVYQDRLRTLNACDFGDLLLHNLTLFKEHPVILNEYAKRFRYILVDEYQDTNIGQYLWLRLLAVGYGNICCVGDDDQSIYGWRGAEVGNILKFEQDYPQATIIRLEQNYRSTSHILSAASAVIANNQGRLGKTLWTEDAGGERVHVKSVWDDNEEARFIGEEVEARQRDKIPLKDMAILVRAGFQTRAFEERLLQLGVPYRVVGGLRFYERQEIRDAIAYLRLIDQPRDDLAFERIINTPKRGLGKATMEQLHSCARDANSAMMDACVELLRTGQLRGKTAQTIKDFLTQHAQWADKAQHLSPADMLRLVMDESGYLAMWQAEKTPEAQGRVENLRELERALAEFPSITAFLEHVGLVMDKEDAAQDDLLSIMTLHAAKGLEFDTVFLPGWEEGVFPHQRAMDESGVKGLEEERRLAYVGITRAKSLLYITHAANRRIYNQWQSSAPSRFLKELPEKDIELLAGGPQAYASAAGPQLMQRRVEDIFSTVQRFVATQQSPKSASASEPVHHVSSSGLAGKRVLHVKFGYGRVLSDTNGNLEISFENAGKKKVMKDYVKVV